MRKVLKKFLNKTPEYLQSIAAIWLILVALTIFAEVAFRNFGFFLGADQVVQNSVPAIVFFTSSICYCFRYYVENNLDI